MSRFKNLHRITHLIVAVALLGLTGCENGNLFGKLSDTGGSNEIAVLASDAQIALDNGDFSRALELYNKILQQDSDNSQALSGAAIAAVGAAGLNFGTVLSNIARQQGAPGVNSLGDLMATARRGYAASAASANSILAGLDLPALDAVLDLAICRLQKIVSGTADGTISPNDPATILNVACLRLIRGVLRPIEAGYFDIVNNNGSYNFVLLADANVVCGNSANDALVTASAQDVVAGFVLFARAATILTSGSGTITANIRDDLGTAITDGLNGGGGNNLPAACVTTINNAGITSANFPSSTEAFSPPSGC